MVIYFAAIWLHGDVTTLTEFNMASNLTQWVVHLGFVNLCGVNIMKHLAVIQMSISHPNKENEIGDVIHR